MGGSLLTKFSKTEQIGKAIQVAAKISNGGVGLYRNATTFGKSAGDFLSMALSGAGAARSAAGVASGINDAAKAYQQWKEIGAFKNLREDSTGDFDLNKLSRSQRKAIESADNNMKDHLKSSDLSGALCDLQGNPIAKPNGGYWNHAQEVKDAYTGLVRAEKTLAGSLQNPNLAPDVRAFIQGKYDSINHYINIIEEMFAAYGGIN